MINAGKGALLGALAIVIGVTAWGQAGGTRNQSSENQTSQNQTSQNQASQNQNSANPASGNSDEGMVIEPTELPATSPHATYLMHFRARGNYVPVLHWRIEKGALPAGIKLSEDGVLRGEAERAGEFHFVVAVRDGDNPQRAVRREFVIKVVEALTLEWEVPAHVTGNRIEGSVVVSNTTAESMDLTFDVKAVNENGRATEIGYQHFPLTRGTTGMSLPFGETLPHGAYMIYVNLVGEVAKRNVIYRQRMQTPQALQVVVGP
jgi:hypothetical protein